MIVRIEFLLALTVALGILFSVGAVIGAAAEHGPAYVRLLRKQWAASRSRRLRRQVICDPWAGAVVKHQRYFTPHWNATVGRAYRAYAAARQSH